MPLPPPLSPEFAVIACALSGAVSHLNASVQASKPVLVDFWATWCGPCKLVLPSVQWIEQEYGDHLKVVKVEADPNPKLMEKYKVLLRHLHRLDSRDPYDQSFV